MNSTEFACGLFTGVTSACIFNPIDKIIFSSCIQGQSLLSKGIYKNLFKGSLNNVGTRLITSGLYFSYIDTLSQSSNSKFTISLITALLCSITNPLQLIKYRSWYSDKSSRLTYKSIVTVGGYSALSTGIVPLIIRDFTFNYIYLNFKVKDNHLYNLGVICSAVVATSPLNLIKNRRYADNSSYRTILREFNIRQLGLGMSISRTCVCFYASQIMYDYFKSNLKFLL